MLEPVCEDLLGLVVAAAHSVVPKPFAFFLFFLVNYPRLFFFLIPVIVMHVVVVVVVFLGRI
jgi:hypothetical protein